MLKSFEATVSTDDYEYILVDDCSSDETPDYLKSLMPPYKVLFNEHNLGFAKSNNKAAKKARGEYLVFLNNDLILSNHWLQPMMHALKSFDNVGVVGNIQMGVKTNLIDHAGVFFDLEGRPAHARKNRASIPCLDYTKWNAVTAACMAIKKRTFLDANGFDESYINGSEDIDLCIRLKQQGLQHYVANRSIIEHHVSKSPGRNAFYDRNSKLLIERWGHLTSEWGKLEWPREYLIRYARKWWKFNATKLIKAIYLCMFRQNRNTAH